jgi:hypothetical protein
MALSLIHTIFNSLQHVMSSHSYVYGLYVSLPGDGSQQYPLLPYSRSYRLATVSSTSYSSLPSQDCLVIAAAPRYMVYSPQEPHRKHHFQQVCYRCVLVEIICLATAIVCRAITQQRLFYSCLFRGRCLATGLHTTVF